MKPHPSLLLLLLCLGHTAASAASMQQTSAEACIAANSGADSLNCLEQLHHSVQNKIQQQQSLLQKNWRKHRDSEELTNQHYQQAISESRLANRYFAEFSHKHCLARIGASGAVASGAGQIYWTCRIELAQQHLSNLTTQLNKQKK